MMDMNVGIIGSGAIVEALYLPILSNQNNINIHSIVDKNIHRANELAEKFYASQASDNYRKILKDIDVAIVAVPNHLHEPITIELLNNDVHVLVEKPMAITSEECRNMIETAKKNQKRLAVGLVRRFYETNRIVKRMLSVGLLGKVKKVEYYEGNISKWETESDYLFKKDKGGGALASIGIYSLDLMSWWLGDINIVQYLDDSEGGVDANAKIEFSNNEGVEGYIEISRTRDLLNTFKLEGELGKIEGGIRWDKPLKLELWGSDYKYMFNSSNMDRNKFTIVNAFELQLQNFFQSILNANNLFIPGEEGIKSTQLVEECFSIRQKLNYPWEISEYNKL